MTDEEWFAANPDRQAHIRKPAKEPMKDKQRAVRYLDEFELQFRSLGPHKHEHRWVVIWRTPADHPTHPNTIIPIPVIDQFAKPFADSDDVLLPYIQSVMEAAQ